MREIDAWFTTLHCTCSTASQAKIFFKVYLTFSCPLLHSSNLSWSALREKETYNKTNHFLIRQSWLFKETNQKTLPCVELKYVSINLNVLVLCGISLTSFAFGDFLEKKTVSSSTSQVFKNCSCVSPALPFQVSLLQCIQFLQSFLMSFEIYLRTSWNDN